MSEAKDEFDDLEQDLLDIIDDLKAAARDIRDQMECSVDEDFSRTLLRAKRGKDIQIRIEKGRLWGVRQAKDIARQLAKDRNIASNEQARKASQKAKARVASVQRQVNRENFTRSKIVTFISQNHPDIYPALVATIEAAQIEFDQLQPKGESNARTAD